MRALAALLILLVSTGVLMVLAARFYLADQRKSKAAKPGPAAIAWNKHATDTTVSLLRTGNVVLRKGTGIFSHIMAQFNRKDKSYSHCGIVLVEHGYPFVYHCTGSENDTRPCIRRDSASHFFSPLHNTSLAIVRYPFADTVLQTLGEEVRKYRRQKPSFDTQFDLATDDKLYCSEFVFKVIIKATADSNYLPVTHIEQGSFIGTDDLFINAHARLLWQVRYSE